MSVEELRREIRDVKALLQSLEVRQAETSSILRRLSQDVGTLQTRLMGNGNAGLASHVHSLLEWRGGVNRAVWLALAVGLSAAVKAFFFAG